MVLFRTPCVGCSADRLGWLALSRGDERGATSRSCQRTRGADGMVLVAGEKEVEEGKTGPLAGWERGSGG